uniref:Uncharacterized protein n=1 Tax=Oryza sativa subsp. japonica TaxID=39947 RepID=Q8H4H3_ORYSJ|nr:hypothetical protein [Oryza sativa Japonica Group]
MAVMHGKEEEGKVESESSPRQCGTTGTMEQREKPSVVGDAQAMVRECPNAR